MKLIFLLALLLAPSAAHARRQNEVNLDEAIRRYGRGDFRQAVDMLTALKKATPADPDVRLWLGKSFMKVRDWEKAVKEIEESVKLRPYNALQHLWYGRAWGARAAHTVFFKAIRMAGRVVKEFETAREIAPKDIDVRFDLLEYYLEAPGIVGGGKDKAEAEARIIAELDPQKGYTARARILKSHKKWDLARKELLQATIDYPRSASALKDMAEFLIERNDFPAALNYAKKALALESSSKQSRMIVAAAQVRMGINLDESERTLRDLSAGSLYDEDPSFEEVHYWMGECYLARGDKAKAHESFKSALAYNPEHERAKARLGQ